MPRNDLPRASQGIKKIIASRIPAAVKNAVGRITKPHSPSDPYFEGRLPGPRPPVNKPPVKRHPGRIVKPPVLRLPPKINPVEPPFEGRLPGPRPPRRMPPGRIVKPPIGRIPIPRPSPIKIPLRPIASPPTVPARIQLT